MRLPLSEGSYVPLFFLGARLSVCAWGDRDYCIVLGSDPEFPRGFTLRLISPYCPLLSLLGCYLLLLDTGRGYGIVLV